MLTTNKIISAVRRKILEETTDMVSDDTLLMNANLAYDDLKIKTFTPDQIKKTTVALTAGVGTLPADFGTGYGPAYKDETDRTSYNEKAIVDLDRNPDIEGYAIIEGEITVTPSTTASINFRYYPSYAELTSSQDPEINEYLHELIIYGAVWRILEDMQSEALAEFYKGRYSELLEEKKSALSNYQRDNQDGGTLINGIRLI